MSQHYPNISNVNISFKQTGGKGMTEHMWSDTHLNRSQGTIILNHSADGRLSSIVLEEGQELDITHEDNRTTITDPVSRKYIYYLKNEDGLACEAARVRPQQEKIKRIKHK